MKIHSQFMPCQIGKALSVALLFLYLMPGVRAATPTVTDFGYERIRINGQPAKGHRPLLVILANFPSGSPLGNKDDYDQLVFGVSPDRSVFSYYLDTSNGRFFWSRGGPGFISTNLTSSDTWANFGNDNAYAANIVAKAMGGAVNFQQFDADNNKIITGDELGILIIHNENVPFLRGITRGALNAQPSGSPVKFYGGVSLVYFRKATTDFSTIVHELTHLASSVDGDDTRDLYGWGCINQNLTLMGCTGDDTNTVHHDSWYKMQFGWVEPRIRSLRDGGIASMPACTQAPMTDRIDAPVILYDPLHGLKEFFLLEYRTRASLRGSGYDTNVSGDGLVIWHIVHDRDNNAAIIPTRAAGPSGQTGWQFCTKCTGMFYSGFNLDTPTTPLSHCPAGGAHSPFPTRFFCLEMNNPMPTGQIGWRWCSKCQGLFYGPTQSGSRCPDSGTHDGSSSANYNLRYNDTTIPGGQTGWFWCKKCQGAFYGNTVAIAGTCPAGGSHDGTASFNYTMHLWEYGVFTRSAPDLSRGNNSVWGGGVTTPNLTWLDGTGTPVRIYIHPFSPGADHITVEWWVESDIWVDFKAPAGGLGIFLSPFNTLGDGLNAVTYGGHLHIKSGTTPETAQITKRMTIDVFGGPVTLGR